MPWWLKLNCFYMYCCGYLIMNGTESIVVFVEYRAELFRNYGPIWAPLNWIPVHASSIMPLNAPKGYQPQLVVTWRSLCSDWTDYPLKSNHVRLCSYMKSYEIFLFRTLILFINNTSLVSTGLMSDICMLSFKYNLMSIVNNSLFPDPHLPSKKE